MTILKRDNGDEDKLQTSFPQSFPQILAVLSCSTGQKRAGFRNNGDVTMTVACFLLRGGTEGPRLSVQEIAFSRGVRVNAIKAWQAYAELEKGSTE